MQAGLPAGGGRWCHCCGAAVWWSPASAKPPHRGGVRCELLALLRSAPSARAEVRRGAAGPPRHEAPRPGAGARCPAPQGALGEARTLKDKLEEKRPSVQALAQRRCRELGCGAVRSASGGEGSDEEGAQGCSLARDAESEEEALEKKAEVDWTLDDEDDADEGRDNVDGVAEEHEGDVPDCEGSDAAADLDCSDGDPGGRDGTTPLQSPDPLGVLDGLLAPRMRAIEDELEAIEDELAAGAVDDAFGRLMQSAMPELDGGAVQLDSELGS
ncbi:unnamed protein product [Prorocentrum cordatum]|uniref:Uncharacterized protein n=1 Tax=Prorocentrum cordatum TaxID=2364126 RepID=A0ABN9ULQ7_9DINO|nr:unnamed protein product [Polarella glacialis]